MKSIMRLVLPSHPFTSILTSQCRHSGSDPRNYILFQTVGTKKASLVFWLAASMSESVAPICGECVCRLIVDLSVHLEETLGRLM